MLPAILWYQLALASNTYAQRIGGDLRITRLSVTNFRNYHHLDLALPPHLVIIQGGNAQGKTNLLEAVHVLATTKSHRTSDDRDLLHRLALEDSPPFARLLAEVDRARGGLKVDILLRWEGKASTSGEATSAIPSPAGLVRKQIKVNDIARRAVDFVGQVNVVVFSAQDIELITGAPALCRRYLDLVNSQIDHRYLRCLQRYNRVLLQRNHLLRLLQVHQAQPEQLEFWDRELVENGSYIMLQRQHLVRRLDELSRRIHHDLSHQAENLELVYLPSVGTKGESGTGVEARFQQALRQSVDREVSQGMTLVGPHRDHLQFRVNGMDTSKYGSRGQQQTVVLALKLAEADYMHAQVGDAPILLLDDVFSELDRTRRQHLLESIVSFQQVLITAVDLDYFEPSFLSQASRLRVREGSIEAA